MSRPEPPSAAQPQLCFGHVMHRRLRPVLHAFVYRAYFLRLPLRSLGQAGFGTALFSRNRFNLLSFHDRDHGDARTPLLPWIDALLAAEGIGDASGEVWLQTMPRVLGFVFNPVSFWFCHRADGALRAVLCDVRNTFGERHLYLLARDGAITNGMELCAAKAMHVSPFCRTEGRYRFRFLRTRVQGTYGHEHTLACVDYDDAGGVLLRTTQAGIGVAPDAAAVLRALFLYPLQTYGVVLRIHWQALRLWLRKVPVHTKPTSHSMKVSR